MALVAGFALATAVFMFEDALLDAPLHSAPGRRTVDLAFERVTFTQATAAPLRFAGAWRLRAADRRLGGVSALAIDGARLIAITDSGTVLRFPKPRGGPARVEIDLLPGDNGRDPPKSGRDSEALLREPHGRGWWVAFENRNQLRLYDVDFRRSLASIDLGRERWPRNAGIEGMATAEGSLLLFPELGGSVLRVTGQRTVELPLAGSVTRVADAVAVPGGAVLLIERQPTLFGFTSALVELRRTATGFAKGRRYPLKLGARDNPEAIAAEPLPGGGTRLWLMTDDNFQPWMRTLLVAYDLSPPSL